MFIHIVYRCKQLGSIKKYNFQMLINELFGKESDCIKIMVPAVLYLIQNNLLYFSASKLDAATLQITSQMKLIVIALFSVLILKRQIYQRQWFAIFLLAVGIALVQFPTGNNTTKNVGRNAMVDKALGFFSVLITCLTSGFAGVYFEKILKKSKVTLWARNVQLSLFSVIPGFFIGCLIMDGSTIKEKGFFGGYNRWTLFSIFCQSVGGIIVAIVVKYADNILKGFANSLSIVLSCIVSYFLFDFNITLIFIIGCGLVLFSSYLYGKNNEDKSKRINKEYINLVEKSDNMEEIKKILEEDDDEEFSLKENDIGHHHFRL